MAAGRSDLTIEEWEQVHRLNRGDPEAGLVPGTIFDFLVEAGLAELRRGRPRLSDAGKKLVLKHKHDRA